MYKIYYSSKAKKDVERLKAAHLAAKAKHLIDVIRSNPYANPPEYEKLVGNLAGKYSRRINIKHRLIYSVDEARKEITVLRMWTHYDN